jgi:hypothetical protein
MSYVLRSGQVIAGLDPEEVQAAAVALGFYGGSSGPGDSMEQPDALAHALVAVAAWRSRRDAEERAHARLRDSEARRADMALCLDRARAHRLRCALDDVL